MAEKISLATLGSFPHDSKCVLAAICQLALMGGELLIDACFGLGKLAELMCVRWELAITPFADSEDRNALSALYDSQFSFEHEYSLAARFGMYQPCENQTAPLPSYLDLTVALPYSPLGKCPRQVGTEQSQPQMAIAAKCAPLPSLTPLL